MGKDRLPPCKLHRSGETVIDHIRSGKQNEAREVYDQTEKLSFHIIDMFNELTKITHRLSEENANIFGDFTDER